MTPEELRAIVPAVVTETLLRLGIDVSSPNAVTEMQADFAFLRRQRRTGEAVRANALRMFFTIVGAVIIGFLSWLGASFAWRPPHS